MNGLIKLVLSLSALIACVQGGVDDTRNLVIQKGLDPRQVVDLDGRIYFIGRTTETYNNAVTLCNDLRMVLVSIEKQDEEVRLANYITENGLDMKSYATSGTKHYNRLFWSGSGQEFTYTNWGADQPDYSLIPVCVSMYISGGTAELRDESCAVENYVICEQNANYCP